MSFNHRSTAAGGFRPEFESLELTSNRGMTEVIRKIFGRSERGSKLRSSREHIHASVRSKL